MYKPQNDPCLCLGMAYLTSRCEGARQVDRVRQLRQNDLINSGVGAGMALGSWKARTRRRNVVIRNELKLN